MRANTAGHRKDFLSRRSVRFSKCEPHPQTSADNTSVLESRQDVRSGVRGFDRKAVLHAHMGFQSCRPLFPSASLLSPASWQPGPEFVDSQGSHYTSCCTFCLSETTQVRAKPGRTLQTGPWMRHPLSGCGVHFFLKAFELRKISQGNQ